MYVREDKSVKRALITGASRGIGKAIAYKFAQMGYELYLTCFNNEELLKNVATDIENKYQVICKCYCSSIDCEEEVSRMFDDIPYLDVLINNAGISYIGLITDMSYEMWKNVINVNLNSCFLTCKAAIPSMLNRKKGKIVNISSVWGNVGASCEAVYSASKSAITGFTKSLAKELGPSGICVNCVAPGVILTDMCGNVAQDVLEEMAEEACVGRNGTPEDVAKAMAYLADAEFITGHVLSVNGGYVI